MFDLKADSEFISLVVLVKPFQSVIDEGIHDRLHISVLIGGKDMSSRFLKGYALISYTYGGIKSVM